MPAGPGIDLRVFVVGFPRSGTTLVQSLLASHSALTSFTESHFFWKHFTRRSWLPGPILTKDPTPRLREFLSENGEEPPEAVQWFETGGGRALRVGPLLPLLTVRTARQLLLVLDELAERRGRPGWVEKTPMHLRYVPFLERVSGARPRTHFIHVVREGLEAVASLHEVSRHWERPYDLQACVARWNADVAFSLGRLASPHDHVVSYEALTSSPETLLRRLLAELGLGWEPEMLERHARIAGPLATGQEPWKADVGRGIRRSATSDRVLTPVQRDHVRRTLRPDLYDRLVGRAEVRR